jgi:hypothetical protein
MKKKISDLHPLEHFKLPWWHKFIQVIKISNGYYSSPLDYSNTKLTLVTDTLRHVYVFFPDTEIIVMDRLSEL